MSYPARYPANSVRNALRSLAVVSLLALNGCMTHALWTGELSETFHSPSSPIRLELFEDAGKGDVLARYDELSPWSSQPKRRAYVVHANAARIESHKKPRFEPLSLGNGFMPISIVNDPGAAPLLTVGSWPYAVWTNGNSFVIFRTNGLSPDGPHALPAYRGGSGNLKIFLLTPITLVLDTSIVGGVVGWIYLRAALSSSWQYPILYGVATRGGIYAAVSA
jgi:hypothetical protein